MEPLDETFDVVVIGAGQAGLSTARHLVRAGLRPERDFVVLDAADGPGGAWRERWDTLTMATVNGIFALPGLDLPEPRPAEPANRVLPAYFAAFEDHFDLRVRRPVRVQAVRDHADGRLVVETDRGRLLARGLVSSTGTWSRPFWPAVPGAADFTGRQLHTHDWPGPAPFQDARRLRRSSWLDVPSGAGNSHVPGSPNAPEEMASRRARVVVVGAGISALGHLQELIEVGATTHWVSRRPPRWLAEEFTREHGRAIVARVDERVRAGLRPRSVVAETGLPLTDEVRRLRAAGLLARRPMFDRVVPAGVAWEDEHGEVTDVVGADAIVWATGFRWALDHLAPLGLRTHAGGIRMDGTRVVADPRIHLVGYGPSASTIGANRAGRAAVTELLAYLQRSESTPHAA